MRELLLEDGVISEQVIYPSNLHEADEAWLINSVREWRKGTLIESSTPVLQIH
jgi:branched-subunit amino acid aminotransferase/4-amino-4-deoxychorismate lyase